MSNLVIGDFDCEPLVNKIAEGAKKINEATSKAREIILKIEAQLKDVSIEGNIWDSVVFPKEVSSVQTIIRVGVRVAVFNLLGFVRYFHVKEGETHTNCFVVKKQLFSVGDDGKPIKAEKDQLGFDSIVDLLHDPNTNHNLLIASIPYIPGLLTKIQEELENTDSK
jgi:hypothetical protein